MLTDNHPAEADRAAFTGTLLIAICYHGHLEASHRAYDRSITKAYYQRSFRVMEKLHVSSLVASRLFERIYTGSRYDLLFRHSSLFHVKAVLAFHKGKSRRTMETNARTVQRVIS